ncbi:MAG: hypothetical protein QM605_03510 [Sphingobium sp.]
MAHAGYALLPSLLFMVGCPTGKPKIEDVEKVEARLSRDPCLKDIAAMRREYQFAKRGWKIDPNRIDVAIFLAGHDGLSGGRFIKSVEGKYVLDDRDYFTASATYVIDSEFLDLWSCGMNMSGGVRHNPVF